MRYPGDQRNFGDRFGEPTAPYGPGAEPHDPEQADDGRSGRDGSPFAPPPGAFAARPGEPFGPSAGGFADRSRPAGGFDAAPHLPPNAPPGLQAAEPGDAHAYRPQPGPSYDTAYGASYGTAHDASGGPGPFDRPGQEGVDAPMEPPHEPGVPTAEPPAEPAGTGRGPNRFLVAAGAIVVGVALAGSGFTVSRMLTGDDAEQPAAAAAPTQSATPLPTPTPAPLQAKFKNRTSDPAPLTLAEVFGKRTFKGAGVVYTRTAWKHDRDCSKGVTGAKLQAVLKKGGCTQVLRASYARGDGLLIGTVGVLNLRTEEAAERAAKTAAGRDTHLQPLPGRKGISKTLGKGLALGTAYSRGHYLIMVWVQRPDGKEIAARDRQKVTAFQQQVVLGSNLYKALHYRGIAGKPLTSR
ncbi:hypothetical protein [Thermomonospora catenispora]|uniref:hypothetical protein n=1 Tax=Thermomonospora catenispora TaxID=2493090 RepID=UPI001121AD71|nr:hypothetical protein [Thermomonospora catenispora]TNY38781.1 hypothetical protein EIO00_00880 [Thermomonospora catenispora]